MSHRITVPSGLPPTSPRRLIATPSGGHARSHDPLGVKGAGRWCSCRPTVLLWVFPLALLSWWSALFLWEASHAPPRSPAELVDATDIDRGWLDRLKSAGGERLALAKAGLLWGAQTAPETPVAGGSCPPGTRRGVLGLPAYAYRDILADRDPSNVRDVAFRAAEDRRDFVPGLELAAAKAASIHAAEVEADPSLVPAGALRRVIATHHKAGTALMNDIFRTIAENRTARYGHFANLRDVEDYPERFTATQAANAASAGVVLDYHLGKRLPDFILSRLKTSPALAPEPEPAPRVARTDALIARQDQDASTGTVSAATLAATAREKAARERAGDCASLPGYLVATGGDGADYRMVHVVRDPVEVLISGYLYHRRLPLDERWLFRPAPELGGRSYADHLENAAPSRAMMAEMGTADDELRMLVLAYRDVERDPRAMNVQLENFFGDFDGTVRRVLRFLLFDEADIPAMAEAAKAFDVRRWSDEELRDNEHFTQAEDREPYRRVIREEPFLNKTMSYMRYAMGYVDEWPAMA